MGCAPVPPADRGRSAARATSAGDPPGFAVGRSSAGGAAWAGAGAGAGADSGAVGAVALGAGAAAAGAAATGTPPANWASSASIRAVSAATPLSVVGSQMRTKATSRSMRGSGACRMSTSERPTVSRLRVMVAGDSSPCQRSASSRSGSDSRAGAEPIFTRNTVRSESMNRSPIRRGSTPRSVAASIACMASAASLVASACRRSAVDVSALVTPPAATTWSSADRVSRAEPPPVLTTCPTASSSTSRPASAATSRTSCAMSSAPMSVSSSCWVRLRMVGTTLCGSVVASTNTTWSGGSSSVFSSAFSAPDVSMWTSSRRYTFVRPGVPSATFARRSRMSSTLLFDAASSSWRSKLVPASIDWQEAQVPSGSPSCGFSQLSTLARMRAAVVLPVPRGPLSR